MDDQLELAFRFASDLAKQLITLATGILALSITFVKDILRAGEDADGNVTFGTLKTAWLLLFLSIVLGVWSLSALTGTLAPVDGAEATELGSNVRIPAAVQVVSFVAGVGVLIGFGWRSLRRR